MQKHRLVRGVAALSTAALGLSLTACGGNLGGSSAEDFPNGAINLTVGQDAGGSTDLIARALAEPVSSDLGVPVPVMNRPGANGALAAQTLSGENADGQELMVINASLIAITSLVVGEDEVVSLDDYEVVTGISQDDYVLVANVDSGWESFEDVEAAGQTIDYATTGVGTGSQLSQELLFNQTDVQGNDVPFDGGSPALTALLGNQVDVTSIQLGEAYPQIEAGEIVPLMVFSEERNQYFEDVPTATELGYDVPVAQYRAIVAPKDTPQETIDTLKDAFDEAFATEAYQSFNENALLTPYELDGAEVAEEWNAQKETYAALIEEYGIDMGGES
ncbi:tripartite tricarboxylate transporter substrate binding protein [Nocardioides zeae]|uniref:Tripartite tricarboxylate transporter substrate binding protein n=1 Tax=Nocardioides imazamoxiresistens TaxID=3231893 RepID=A0ABU3PS88_9ACTN|nr:tripartite tricarboxylate transporter substrate binding protein [Nocardioides zeae]MDT9592088.1 tripartite tricarboxylate transporter substrate binding protein [Nocardioides zeae]